MLQNSVLSIDNDIFFQVENWTTGCLKRLSYKVNPLLIHHVWHFYTSCLTESINTDLNDHNFSVFIAAINKQRSSENIALQ